MPHPGPSGAELSGYSRYRAVIQEFAGLGCVTE